MRRVIEVSKVYYLSVPAHGHINPNLGLVRGLVERGEEVFFYAYPQFRSAIEKTGAVFRNYPQNAIIDLFKFNAIDIANMLLEASIAILPKILEDARKEKPQYIIHEALAVWGKYAASFLGIPAANTITSFAINEVSAKESKVLNKGAVKDILFNIPGLLRHKKLTGILKASYGIDGWGLRDVLFNEEELNIVYNSRYFQPGGYKYDQRFSFIGPCLNEGNVDESFPLAALDGKDVIYISLGTIYNKKIELFKTFVETFKDSAYTVVMSCGSEESIKELGEIPGNFIVRSKVPQIEVLKRSKVHISHGGMNSVVESIYLKVPLVVIPQTLEQSLNAEAVERIGVGVCNRDKSAKSSKIWNVFKAVIDNADIKLNIEKAAESFSTAGGIGKAVDDIFKLKEKHGVIRLEKGGVIHG